MEADVGMKKLLFFVGLALVLRAGAQVQNPPLHHGFVTTNEVRVVGGTNINVTTQNSGPSNTITIDYAGTGTAGPQGPPGTNTTVVVTTNTTVVITTNVTVVLAALVISPTNLLCATGGLVTNNDPRVYVSAADGPTFGGGGIGGHSVYRWTATNITYISEFSTCTNSPSHLLWLVADTNAYTDFGTTLAVGGQTVMQWNDISGHGYNVTQPSSVKSILYETNVLAGHASVRFSGGVQGVLSNTNIFGGQPLIIYLVAQCTNVYPSPNNDLFFSNTTNGLLDMQMSGALLEQQGGSTYPSCIKANYSYVPFPTNRFNVVVGVYNGTNSDLFQNGVEVGCGLGGPPAGLNPLCGGNLLGFTIDPSFTSDTDVLELIIDTDLGQMSSTKAYLTGKYGL
jgi:hypothetical protein